MNKHCGTLHLSEQILEREQLMRHCGVPLVKHQSRAVPCIQ